jgi:hypothetical protein
MICQQLPPTQSIPLPLSQIGMCSSMQIAGKSIEHEELFCRSSGIKSDGRSAPARGNATSFAADHAARQAGRIMRAAGGNPATLAAA